ncbi:MAG: hypothetical protein WCF84_22240 [Anaerolineae bacterium]
MHHTLVQKYVKYMLALALGLMLSGLVLTATASAASPSDTPAPGAPSGRLLGVITPRGAISPRRGTTNLSYHNGPVMHTNKVYAIYWQPSGYTMSATYQTLINKFFTDVAAASGQTTNVYYSDTQYSDTTGAIAYSSTFGGSYLDTNAYPASGCNVYSGVSLCLSDAQLQTEINRVVSLNGWTANSSTEFFMFTAKGVGSCSGSSCAFTQFCAYHSWIGSGATATLYANMPYTGTNLSACGVTQSPNGDVDADSTINVTSHEHNETITDEQGSAWYDSRGYENGDKCAWNFGTYTGNSNQTINGDHYFLQQEWSNKSTKCVLTGQ